MELTAMFGSIGLCVGAIVAAAVIYFVVTAIKGKRAERKERATGRLRKTGEIPRIDLSDE